MEIIINIPEEIKRRFDYEYYVDGEISKYTTDTILQIITDGFIKLNELKQKQEPKTGHWSRKTKVDAYDIAGVKTWGIKCQCDRCDFTTIVVEDFGYYKFCPNCGAKMKGDTE